MRTKQVTKQHKWMQILWWAALYIFWVMVFQKRAFAFSQTLTVQFCYLIFIAANFYFNTYFFIPLLLYKKQYAAFAGSMVAGIFVSACLRVPLVLYLNLHYFLVNKPQPGTAEIFYNSFLNIFIWVVGIIALRLARDRFRFQQYVEAMEQEKAKAELDFLNAQFNPHFLFNSINSIYGHIDKNNTTARNMLLTFSDMLRYQLYDCNTNAIAINKEMHYVKNYVAMQQTRKEESLIIELYIAEQVTGCTIAPLLFVAFIENAFKYVSNSEDMKHKVCISFEKNDDTLLFTCFNTRERNNVDTILHKGIGIANARRRMALLYPGKHELSIKEEEHTYEVALKLDLS